MYLLTYIHRTSKCVQSSTMRGVFHYCQEAMKMREKLQRFMWGRYGTDSLNQFLLASAFICLVISFFGWGIFYILATVAMVYAYYRMFSRNISRRAMENQWFLSRKTKVFGFFTKKKRELGQRRVYHIYRCPKCRQKLRVPRGRGRIAISCRKCGNEFIRKS